MDAIRKIEQLFPTQHKNVLDRLIYENCKNKCGYLDYNVYGQKLGLPLKKVSDLFLDNFLLYVYADIADVSQDSEEDTQGDSRDSQVVWKFAGSANKQIREILFANGLPCKVTCVRLQKEESLGVPFGGCGQKVKVFKQFLKVDTAEHPAEKVLGLLHSKEFQKHNVHVADLDVTGLRWFLLQRGTRRAFNGTRCSSFG